MKNNIAMFLPSKFDRITEKQLEFLVNIPGYLKENKITLFEIAIMICIRIYEFKIITSNPIHMYRFILIRNRQEFNMNNQYNLLVLSYLMR